MELKSLDRQAQMANKISEQMECVKKELYFLYKEKEQLEQENVLLIKQKNASRKNAKQIRFLKAKITAGKERLEELKYQLANRFDEPEIYDAENYQPQYYIKQPP